jgi:hypothetical protein
VFEGYVLSAGQTRKEKRTRKPTIVRGHFVTGSTVQRELWWRSWLRHCATSRKVAGSIPDGVIGIIFH